MEAIGNKRDSRGLGHYPQEPEYNKNEYISPNGTRISLCFFDFFIIVMTMVDIMTAEQRKKTMSRIRSKDTKPEMIVRRLVHGMGYRYRLHDKRLPGCPDMVFKKYGKVIFVHGCFWHRHKNCPIGRLPQSRRDYWVPKLNANRKRDAQNLKLLEKANWSCLVIWECETKNFEKLAQRIISFLS